MDRFLSLLRFFFILMACSMLDSSGLPAQGLNIPFRHYGISIGNSKQFTGLRLNFRDKEIESIRGINLTVWAPKDMEMSEGVVNGLALGLPIAAGGAQFNGIAVALAGTGVPATTRGIHVAGIGIGAGVDVLGVNVAGIGVGAGGRLAGLTIAGLGIGAGDAISGINVAGLGIGSGQSISGLNMAGLGLGAGGDLVGVNIAGLGMGAGTTIAGINIAGLGIGAGLSVKGLNVAGLGIGGLEVSGISVAGFIRGETVKGLAIAPFYHRVKPGVPGDPASLQGVGISAFNNIQGQQRGLTIGLLNIAYELKGIQLGVINIARNNRKGLRVLPLFNANFR